MSSRKRSKPDSDQFEALKKRLKQKFQKAKLETQTESENLEKIFKPIADPIREQTKLQIQEGKEAAAQRQHQIKKLLAIEAGQQHQQKQHGERLKHIQRALENATGTAADTESEDEIEFNQGIRRRLSSSMGALPDAQLALTPARSSRYLEEASLLSDSFVKLGPLATTYLSMFATRESLTDPTFGIRYNPDSKQYMIGAMEVDFSGNDLIVGGKRYEGTDELWQLMMLKHPQKPPDDHPSLLNYHDILKRSKAIYHNNDDSHRRLKSSAGHKYTTFIKPVWGKPSEIVGKGYRFYRNPNDLCDRLKLIRASRDAGNDSLDQEFVHIFTEMRSKALLSNQEYQDLIRDFGKC